ncbi:MAG: undecaprenyldiphospho-muramoylpentapeptide beta-N-acetylglucosaminyltransferase [Bacteroidota bacterium]
MPNSNLRKVIISGGGTGGHVFPAIAIANALKAKDENIEILFVGSKDRMEMEKVPAAGYEIEGLWISGFQRRLTLKNLSFPFKLISSIVKANKILNRFKPQVVVGVGGYASGPVLYMAAKKGIPTLIQEQNSYPGITNKLLAKKVDKICVAYDNMDRFFPKEKIILTGNPVRQDILDLEGKKEKALQYFGLTTEEVTPPETPLGQLAERETLRDGSPSPPAGGRAGEGLVLLVIGGSLGARTINQSISNNLELFIKNQIQVIWQTGKGYYEKAISDLCGLQNRTGLKVYDFINKMDYAYSVADIIVSRAGAIAVSELCSVGKPVVLIPSPNVAEDHQTKNAIALVDKNAAIMIKDNQAIEKLGTVVIDLINDETKRKSLSENIAKLALKDSAEIIAKEILNLVEEHNLVN